MSVAGGRARRPRGGDGDVEPVPEGPRRHRDVIRGRRERKSNHLRSGESAEVAEDEAATTAATIAPTGMQSGVSRRLNFECSVLRNCYFIIKIIIITLQKIQLLSLNRKEYNLLRHPLSHNKSRPCIATTAAAATTATESTVAGRAVAAKGAAAAPPTRIAEPAERARNSHSPHRARERFHCCSRIVKD